MSDDGNTASKTVARWLSAGRKLLVGTTLAVLGLAAFAYVALPWQDDDPAWAERWLSETLQREIDIDRLELALDAGLPELRLRDVWVQAPKASGREGLALTQVRVEISVLRSIRHGRLYPRRIGIAGAELSLSRDADGLITLDGLGQERRPAREVLQAVLSALPEDCEFSLEDTKLLLPAPAAAAADAPRMMLSPLSLQLGKEDGGIRLALQMVSEDDGAIRAQARWEQAQDVLAGTSLSVSAEDVPVDRIARALAVRLPDGLEGAANLDLEAQLRGARFVTARGALQLNGLRRIREGELNGDNNGAVKASRVTSLFDLDQVDGDWQLNLLRVALDDGENNGASRGSGRIRSTAWSTGPYKLELDAVSLTDLRKLASSLAPAIGRRLDALEEGRLENVGLRIPALGTSKADLQLEADFADVRLGNTFQRLDLEPASGTLRLRGRAGTLHLNPVGLTLPSPTDGIRTRLEATGELDYSFDASGVSLRARGLEVSDGGVRARITGTMRLGAANDGRVSDLEARIERISRADLLRHLSPLITSQRLDRWLHEAFPAGEFSNITITHLGTSHDLEEFSRALRVEAEFEGLQIDYSKKWPGLTDLRGQLSLSYPEFSFRLEDGQISGTRIEQGTGLIEDVRRGKSLLRLEGQLAGPIEKGVSFLLNSPLKRRFSGLLSQLSARGAATLDVQLDIPLNGDRARSRGTLRLRNNVVDLPALRSDLDKVNGSIRFSEAGVRDGTLQARYLDGPIEATLDGTRSPGLYTDLEIKGRTSPTGLIRHLYGIGALDSPRSDDLPVLRRLAGETSGTVALRIPSAANPDQSLPLRVHSTLQGMGLKLPEPLGKSRAQTKPLEIRTRLGSGGKRVFEISYGKRTRGRLEVHAEADGYSFSRAGITFGGPAARLPDQPGLLKVDGQLATMSVDDWLGLIAEADKSLQARSAALSAVNRVDVRASRLNALGNGFDDVRLRLQREDGNVQQLSLDGEGVQGNIRIPLPLGTRLVTVEFSRLHASQRVEPGTPGQALPAPALDVHSIPAVDARVADLRYGDLLLGEAGLSLRPVEGGVGIERLELTNPAYGVAGFGTWTESGGRQVTSLRVRLQGKDLGRTLQSFGYFDNGVQGAPVDVALSGAWDGSPLAFSLARMQGTLELRAGKGRFTGIEPGTTGRMFGLLSVTMLPRRLFRLDFSDLFGKGIGFRRIRGRFDVEDGNAYTNNFSLDADTAQVDIVGRVGLEDQDYDQVMTVAPKLSSSLPLAPLWLAEQVLDRKLLDPAFAYSYSITGSWDEPKVERIRKIIEEKDSEPRADR